MRSNQIILPFSRKSEPGPSRCLRIYLFFLILFIPGSLLTGTAQVIRKTPVEYYASDSLLITADHYFSNKDNPYILLFHQENSSRGEFDSIAERFVKMRYNCLAVDSRKGDQYGFIVNMTARRAKENNDLTWLAAERDIIASIEMVRTLSDKKVILLGSSLSASLCLKIASEDERVKAVMAFSPGEFLQPEYSLKDIFSRLQKPAYIAVNVQEYSYIKQSTKHLTQENISMVIPPENAVTRGIPMLYSNNPGNNEYWFSLLIFIKSLQD